MKLSPVIAEWRTYNKFSLVSNTRFSLFFIKKRAFKIFKKESKQDVYSSKKLLSNIFSNENISKSSFFFPAMKSFLENPHKSFWSDYFLTSINYQENILVSEIKFYYFCIDCGIFIC